MKLFSSLIFLFSVLFFYLNLFAKTVVVVDKGKNSVLLLDPETFSVRESIRVEKAPREVSISPFGKFALVTHSGGSLSSIKSSLSFINIREGVLDGEIQLPKGSRPQGTIFLDEKRALILAGGSQSLFLLELEGKQKTVKKYMDLSGKGACSLVKGPNSDYLYVASKNLGTVIKIDIATKKIIVEVKIGKSALGLAISKKGDRLVVGNRKENSVSLLDTKDLSVLWETKVSKNPLKMMFFGRGEYVAVTSSVAGKIDVLNVKENKYLKSFKPIGDFNLIPVPVAILSAQNQQAIVANSFTGHVSLVSLVNGKTIKTVKVGKEIAGMAMSSVSVGGAYLSKKLRELERPQCSDLHDSQCYDKEGFPQSFSTSTFKVIDAPKEVVWSVLTDLKAYPTWNPFMLKTSSSLRVGSPISFEVLLNEKFPFTRELTILSREENRSICWGGKVLGKPFEVKRCFDLIELRDGKTLYVTRERFKGFFASFMFNLVGETVKKDFKLEASALKKQAESLRSLKKERIL